MHFGTVLARECTSDEGFEGIPACVTGTAVRHARQ
jgi:hypothetical protein